MTTTTWTPEADAALRDYLASHPLCYGISDKADEACSVTAINLALTGELTGTIPECMSLVIGEWIIRVQDSCPPELCRHHPEWLALLPLAAGTGRDREPERLAIVLDWMWETVLPSLQHTADLSGFGGTWRVMRDTRTADAARAAADALYGMRELAQMEYEAGVTNNSAEHRDRQATYVMAFHAAYVVANAAEYVATNVANNLAFAAASAAALAAPVTGWAKFNPCDMLRQLIEA